MRIPWLLLIFSCLCWTAGCAGGGKKIDGGADAQDGADDGGPDGGGDEVPDGGDEVPDGGDEVPDGGDEAPTCTLDHECPPGQVCRGGSCEDFVAECATDGDCLAGEACRGGRCLAEEQSPFLGTLVFNEVLADGDTDGDPNGDGSRDPVEDEFVELVNVSNTTVDLSGFTLVESNWDVYLPRHTFTAGTVIEPLGAVVVFGGGEPPASSATVLFLASNAQDPGTTYGLDLDDAGDLIRLLDASGLLVARFSYGSAGGPAAAFDQSLTRAPDLDGDFQPHTTAGGEAESIFSPGTRLDGSAF